MKRLNPDTGKPFVRGDTRADGFLFFVYTKRIRKDGFFQEVWYSPNSFENHKRLQSKSNALYVTQSSGRANTLINSAKRRCANRGRGLVTIDTDWIVRKIEIGFCELTGLPFDMSKPNGSQTNPYAPSLDRIDNSNPDYSKSNTRVVLSIINTALADHGLCVLLPVVKALAEKQSNV